MREKTSEQLCATIERYWRDRGQSVKCRVEMVDAVCHVAVPVVRSDMVNGLPAPVWASKKINGLTARIEALRS